MLLAGSVLVGTLLASTGEAATLRLGTVGLAVSVQQGITPLLAGPVTFGPRVIVPTAPTPRSPFQPPTWVPTVPPWLR